MPAFFTGPADFSLAQPPTTRTFLADAAKLSLGRFFVGTVAKHPFALPVDRPGESRSVAASH